ncbi:hypothetical protein SS50377_27806 [Spironucleus salmonicida]|uniref:Uncharacterized protein n=1 Tax=Spironucleus salmonicida TaxID=348837 RepID=V6M660_9EUKA|nr:hypothetical protein SS50377_27806 [Spironucleus salmonicida]|eukprot:EST48874.1 Hypothetical protein SS50377_10978 [Spironucleus salmonicida]
MKQNMYGSRPTSTSQKTTLNSAKSQSESQIAKENAERRKRQQNLQKRLEDEEQQRIQDALLKKKQQQQQITQIARQAVKSTPISQKKQHIRSESPDPKQEAQQDFQKFLSKVKEAAGATNLDFLEKNLSQSKSRIASAKAEPTPLDQSRQRINDLPKQKIDPLNDMYNDDKTLIDTSDDQEYENEYDRKIFVQKEQLQIEMLSNSSDDEEEVSRRQLSIRQKQNELRELTESKKLDRSVIEQVKQFKESQQRALKVQETLKTKNKQDIQKPPPARKHPGQQEQSRLSLEIKNYTSQEKQLENELNQLDQKLYKLDQLSVINLENIQQYNSNTEASVFDNFNSRIDDQTQIELLALNQAQLDSDGNITNKDEVAAIQRKLRAELSRKIISQSTAGKAKKQLQVVNIISQTPIISNQLIEDNTPKKLERKIQPVDQNAINAMFMNEQPSNSKEDLFRAIVQQQEFPVRKIQNYEPIQQNIYDTAPAVELSMAAQEALSRYDGSLNENFQEKEINDESDMDDLYGNMQEVNFKRGSVEYKGEIYEADDDDEDYDFGGISE